MLYAHLQHHNDTIINRRNDKDAGRLLYKNMYLSLYCKGSKRLFKVCVWEGVGDRTELKYFDPHSYGRQRCVFLVLLMLNRRPRGPLCWVMAFFTASYQHLLWTSTHQGPKAPSVWCGFPYHISSITYIIVQRPLGRPLGRPLDLWNRMLDRHQAEITVIQFRGHSLPVRQSMRVSWDFFSLSHFVSQFPPTRFPLLAAIGMCHFLLVHPLEWHFGLGWRSKYNTKIKYEYVKYS